MPEMPKAIRRYLPLAERVAWSLGVVLLGSYGAIRLEQARLARADLARFEALRGPADSDTQAPGRADAAAPRSLAEPLHPDFSLWTASRIRAYVQSLGMETRQPIALLEIPRLKLKAAVIEGTDEAALNRGLGHIEGTPPPGMEGNVGIAGHRDGLFRCLKDVAPGDELRLVTPDAEAVYTVADTWIVAPEDVAVLAPTERPSVTLVTCYPFYYAGNAPKRFIVRAYRTTPGGRAPGSPGAPGPAS